MSGSGSAVYGIFKEGTITQNNKLFSDYFVFRGKVLV
jgi:hypothetical protein